MATRAGSGSERPDELVGEVAVDERHDHPAAPTQFDVSHRAAAVGSDLVGDPQRGSGHDVADGDLGLVPPGAGAVFLAVDEVLGPAGGDAFGCVRERFALKGVHDSSLVFGGFCVE